MVVGSLIVGWLIPEFYEWSESEQSRLGSAVLWFGLAILAACLCLNLGLLWLHFIGRSDKVSIGQAECGTGGLQKFNLRHLLGLVAIVAVLLAIGRGLSPTVSAWIVFGMTIAWAIWVAIRNQQARWWIAMIVCLQFAPFLWVIRSANLSDGSAGLLAGLPALPSMFVTIWLNVLVRFHFEEGMWINVGVTSLMLASGVWLAVDAESGPWHTVLSC
jgi:hypothetical protein